MGTSHLYLSLANYEKDEIYIDVSGNGTRNSSNGETEYNINIQFLYVFSDTLYGSEYQTYGFYINSPVSTSSTGYVTNSCSIRYGGGRKYLLMKIINNDSNSYYKLYKITQTKPKPNWRLIIIYIVFSLINILAIVCCVRDCIGTKKSNKEYMDDQPLAPLDNQKVTDE